MAKARPRFEDLVRRVGPLRVTGLAAAEAPAKPSGTDAAAGSRADVQAELRRMVSEYDGKATRSRDLLEALVIAEEEGVPAEFCAEIRHQLAVRVRKLRAA
jgi:hypothetical protein